MSRFRNYVFTDFTLKDFKELPKGVRAIAYGVEVCPKTKRKHHQGFVQFEREKSLKAAQKALGLKDCHFEVMRGSVQDNEKYCGKDGEYSQLGEFTKKGERVDIAEFYKELKEGKSDCDLMEMNPGLYSRTYRAIDRMRFNLNKRKAKGYRKLTVRVLWGATNLGKTRRAYEQEEDLFKWSPPYKWWDGYDGEDAILIDEYDSQLKLTELLGILDGYPKRLPIKGGMTWALYTKVFITSNVDPLLWHGNAKEEHRQALYRRLTTVNEITEEDESLAMERRKTVVMETVSADGMDLSDE